MVKDGFFREISHCRVCGGTDLPVVIDLGDQALTGCFPILGEADAPKAPLVAVRCTQCGLVQLRHSVSVEMMFGEQYGYRSGVNATMRKHLSSIAANVARRAGLKGGDAVLDIGCNDGTLLESYPMAGLLRIGIDPTAEMFRAGYPSDFRVRATFFDQGAFRETSGRQTARAITSISMFYDLENPAGFVADIAAVLAPDGIWVLEQSYLPGMLERNSFDTICHEHLEYYAMAQIERLVLQQKMRIFDVSLNEINGGSFQIWVCHDQAPHLANQSALDELAERERRLALNTAAPYDAFRARIAVIGNKLHEFILKERQQGKSIFVYGASTKGNVLLQHLRLNAEIIQGCADKNPIKWGRRTPGTAIPIMSEEEARKKADYFLVLPWHFRDEFLERETNFRAKGGKFIFPLPAFEVV